MNMSKMSDALELLNQLTDTGMDYPDAEWRVLEKFGIDQTELKDLYDAQFEDKRLTVESLDQHAIFMGWK